MSKINRVFNVYEAGSREAVLVSYQSKSRLTEFDVGQIINLGDMIESIQPLYLEIIEIERKAKSKVVNIYTRVAEQKLEPGESPPWTDRMQHMATDLAGKSKTIATDITHKAKNEVIELVNSQTIVVTDFANRAQAALVKEVFEKYRTKIEAIIEKYLPRIEAAMEEYIEEYKPKIHDYLQGGVGKAEDILGDEEFMKKTLHSFYPDLPFAFRLVVKQDTFVKYVLANLDYLLEGPLKGIKSLLGTVLDEPLLLEVDESVKDPSGLSQK